MGYDVQFIQVDPSAKATFPIDGDSAEKLCAKATPFTDLNAIRETLLASDGFRPGPEADAVDFMGKGLSYARLFVRAEAIHIENNANARDLLAIYHQLRVHSPTLVILDLQTKQLHDAKSFSAWWSRPL